MGVLEVAIEVEKELRSSTGSLGRKVGGVGGEMRWASWGCTLAVAGHAFEGLLEDEGGESKGRNGIMRGRGALGGVVSLAG